MSEKITIPVEFTIGTLEEIGLSLRQEWLSAEHDGAKLDLACGAGLGSGVLEASCSLDGHPSLYALADIRTLARVIFGELEHRVRAGKPEPRGEEDER